MQFKIINRLLTLPTFCLILLLIGFSCTQSTEGSSAAEISEDELKIRQVHQDYVDGWKSMDEQKVMGLLEEESQIQPNRFTPVIGKENIRAFWFPNDSSKTVINEFSTEIISIKVKKTKFLISIPPNT